MSIELNGGFVIGFVNEDNEDDCTVLVSSNGAELIVPLNATDPQPVSFSRGGKWYLVYYQTTNEEERLGELRVVNDHLEQVSTKEVSMLVEDVAWVGDHLQLSGRVYDTTHISINDFF